VTFHDQTDEAFALLIRLGEKLLGRSQHRFAIGFHFDLGYGFDRHGDALFRIKILLRRHVERHQFQGKILANLHHGKHERAMSLHDASSAQAVHDERLVRPRFAIEPGHAAHQEQDDHHSQPNENPDRDH